MQANNTQTATGVPLATHKDIAQALKSVGIQVDGPGTLSILGDHYGREEFRAKIKLILSKQAGHEAVQKEIASAVLCLTHRESINNILGYEVGASILMCLAASDDVEAVLSNVSMSGADSQAANHVKRTVAIIENEMMHSGAMNFDFVPPIHEPEVRHTAQSDASRAPETATQSVSVPSAAASVTRTFHQQHVYGGSAALCFSTSSSTKEKYQTIRIEAAPTSGTRTYDWKRKVSIQLSNTELVELFALFQGWKSELKLEGHGEANDKFATFKLQDFKGVTSFYATVQQKGGKSMAIPIPMGYAYEIAVLLMKQMRANATHLSDKMIYQMIERMYQITPPLGSGDH